MDDDLHAAREMRNDQAKTLRDDNKLNVSKFLLFFLFLLANWVSAKTKIQDETWQQLLVIGNRVGGGGRGKLTTAAVRESKS